MRGSSSERGSVSTESSFSESGAFAGGTPDWIAATAGGFGWAEACCCCTAGCWAGAESCVGAERDGALDGGGAAAAVGGVREDGAPLLSVALGRIVTVRTFFGSPMADGAVVLLGAVVAEVH